MTSTLLVSCIMPTRNRRRFVGQAIWYFLRQDYPSRELIIVDDGEDAVADLVPDDKRIRHVRLEERLSVGAKRNLACELSRGELIAHWDDDDWHAPHRLNVQVAGLSASGADVCGASDLLFYHLDEGKAWLYRYPADQRPWLAGGTLLYRRSAWAEHPFPDRNVGEDTAFVWSFPPERLHIVADPSLYVGLIHDRNTGFKNVDSRRWERRPLYEVNRLLALDRDFYVALRNGTPWPDARQENATVVRSRAGDRPQSRQRNPPQAGLRSDLDNCRVTVSIPYFQCQPYIRRAVESILGQSHANLIVVVVNDGDAEPPWAELAHITDPRLVRFDLARNRGRYFADAVVLNATSAPYFVIQDADDWSDPDRIAVLLDKLREDQADGVVSSIYRYHMNDGKVIAKRKESYSAINRPLTKRLEHRACHVGLFRSEFLKKIGGYYGGFRIGYDTQILSFLLMAGRISYVDRPLYNRLVRPGSLTNSKATGMKSPARHHVHQQLQEIYSEVYEHYTWYLGGEIGKEAICKLIRQIRSKYLPRDTCAELMEASQRLRTVLRSG